MAKIVKKKPAAKAAKPAKKAPVKAAAKPAPKKSSSEGRGKEKGRKSPR
ncbi:hypothetical protein [Bdellovibrio bacteriovorus]